MEVPFRSDGRPFTYNEEISLLNTSKDLLITQNSIPIIRPTVRPTVIPTVVAIPGPTIVPVSTTIHDYSHLIDESNLKVIPSSQLIKIVHPPLSVRKVPDRKIKEPVKKIPQLEVQSHQKAHYKRITKILRTNYSYLDTSSMGAGKTYITLIIASVLKYSLFVIAPCSMLKEWERLSKVYGINLYPPMSYAKLRGVKKSGCNHPFLRRAGDNFYPTDYLKECISKGTLFVFDEIQNVKNDNAQQGAAHAIVRTVITWRCPITGKPSKSRIALLSATPSDKDAISVLKMLGIITCKKLYDYDRKEGRYIPTGLKEVATYSNHFDKEKTKRIYQPELINKKLAKEMCFQMYTEILKDVFTSSSEPPPVKQTKDIKNGYYILSEKQLELLNDGRDKLYYATEYDEGTGQIINKRKKFGAIQKAMMEIETAKLPIIIRLAKEILSNPRAKLIIYVWYLKSMDILGDALGGLIMNGSTKLVDRTAIMDGFQAPTGDYRLIISNPVVGGVGVSLDDRYGDWPRYMLIVPSYRFIELHQATGRIFRSSTKSGVFIRFIYAKNFDRETAILDSLARKSAITKKMIYDGDQIIFPGEYPVEYEGATEEENRKYNEERSKNKKTVPEDYLNI